MRNTFGVQGSPVNAERVFQIPRSTREPLKQTTDGVCLESGAESFSRHRHEFRALKMLRVRAESQRKLQSEVALRASIRHQLGGHGFRSTTMYPAQPKRRPTRWKEETMAFHHRNSPPAINFEPPVCRLSHQVFRITLIFPTRPPTPSLPLPRVQRPKQPGEG